MKRSVFWYLAACPDVVRAFFLEPTVEEGRRTYGPAPLLQMMRKRGAKRAARSPRARERLRFAIAKVEALRRRSPNCYRRVLLEVALDAGAAREQVFLALRSGEGPGSGHAYLQSHNDAEARDGSYDAVFAM